MDQSQKKLRFVIEAKGLAGFVGLRQRHLGSWIKARKHQKWNTAVLNQLPKTLHPGQILQVLALVPLAQDWLGS